MVTVPGKVPFGFGDPVTESTVMLPFSITRPSRANPGTFMEHHCHPETADEPPVSGELVERRIHGDPVLYLIVEWRTDTSRAQHHLQDGELGLVITDSSKL